jgi:hypothetical protein
MRTWNKRAVQGALIRLDQSGMIRRFRVRKRKSEDAWVICIQIQRAPSAEDLENLGFRRQAHVADTVDELLQDDVNDDDPMKDLEADMLDDGDENVANNHLAEETRIPPQWTPDRLLGNIIFDVTALGGANGWDALVLRDRVVGPFWRRAMESHLTRLTDDWERTQPPYLRHLAIIRDTRNTEEKKFIHYVYRTFRHFQEAVSGGEATWAGVCRPASKPSGKASQKKSMTEGLVLDMWGFHGLNPKDFVQLDGTATLSDVRSAIVNPRKYGPRWDIALAEEIGYQKLDTPFLKHKVPRRTKKASIKNRISKGALQDNENGDGELDMDGEETDGHTTMLRKNTRKKGSGLTLTPEQRVALGLKPSGRLSKSATKQILAHRRETDDPTSLPDRIVEEPVVRVRAPLMTKEERLAENLPPKGRLGLDKENEIREKRGLPKLLEKVKKKRVAKETVLTKQQRVALGLKSHGRLHQHFIDALRREQENDVPLDESPAVEAYREFLKAEAARTNDRKDKNTHSGQTTPACESTIDVTDEAGEEASTAVQHTVSETGLSPMVAPGKRRLSNSAMAQPASKRHHFQRGLSQEALESAVPHVPILMDNIGSLGSSNDLSASGNMTALEKPRSSPCASQENSTASVEKSLVLSPKPILNAMNGESSLERAARSSPGVYIYRSAKRKVARGRPRNACIAVFHIPRLDELPWFKTGPSEGYDAMHSNSMDVRASAQMEDSNMDGLEASPATPASVSVAPAMRRVTEPEAPPQQTMSAESGCREVVVAVGNGVEEAVSQMQSDEQERGQATRSQRRSSDTKTQTQIEISPSQVQESASDMQERFDAVTVEQAPLEIEAGIAGEQSMPRAVAGWNAMSASAQVTQPAYHSPYAPSTRSDCMAPAQQALGVDATINLTTRPAPPAPEMNHPVTMPQGVVGAIAEIQEPDSVAPKKISVRSAGPGITGSALKFRREIILEIIDRCGGVFPLHGEIWRPFSAMWDRRHGHTSISKPQSSTVSDTLKNMIIDPAFNLKRMAFRVKARNAAGAKDRVIVARSDISPNDPKVMRLAYNMANHALDKSHQFFPKEITDIFNYEKLYVPLPIAPKDETVTLDQFYPELEYSIKENKERRRREKAAQKKAEKEAAKKQNEQVEIAVPRRQGEVQAQANSGSREKRTRLASLNDKNKRYRRAPAQVSIREDMEDVSREAEVREARSPSTDSSEDVPLMDLRPYLVKDIADQGARNQDTLPSDAEEDADEALHSFSIPTVDMKEVSFTHPVARFHASTGTFSTFFNLIKTTDELPAHEARTTVCEPGAQKRVRIDEPVSKRPLKKARRNIMPQQEALDDEFVYSSTEDSDATSSEDEDEEMQPKKQKKKRATSKRQVGKKLPAPTLLERLTGLTGDPNDPIYKDPKQRQRHRPGRPWIERKKKQLNKVRKDREYAESLDDTETFKKLCMTLVLASSMSGEDNIVNWNIVEKVYARDVFFDLSRVKRLWSWMRIHMAVQLTELVQTFQTNFLRAYDAGRLPIIDDPEAYDWAGLIRWTMRTCTYHELPLPLRREAIQQFAVDESKYTSLDRVAWYNKKLADSSRTQLQLQLSFVAPLHKSHAQVTSMEENVIKARSWIRANTATPQAIYDAHLAHEKLKVLGDDILTRVVKDCVQQEHLKMRKLKRQLPGRNYTFTKKFAKTYKRPFELEDFMVATTVKKELDTAFAHENSADCFYSVSRCEEDGSLMAIMSLVADGKVKLIPVLPPVTNEFAAPLPRLSKWGFCEGDYIHRAIDRNRLFWDTHVVPTSKYKFGSPLQRLTSPDMDWPSLPEPPLPGKYDSNALLPIWSSIDGQAVTWPWWYRILNLVLQPLYLQPGATAADIRSHCPEYTTETFEIELVLGWLESIGAITKTVGGGHQVTLDFWAAFGDKLLDTKDDWFGEHVKRHTKMTTKQQWRDKYNMRYATIQTHVTHPANTDVQDKEQANARIEQVDDTMRQQIIYNSRAQYRILQQALLEQASEVQGATVQLQREEVASVQGPKTTIENKQSEQNLVPVTLDLTRPTSAPRTLGESNKLLGDVDMVDSNGQSEDMDAEGEVEDVDVERETYEMDAEGELDDIDAEGEEDDVMY